MLHQIRLVTPSSGVDCWIRYVVSCLHFKKGKRNDNEIVLEKKCRLWCFMSMPIAPFGEQESSLPSTKSKKSINLSMHETVVNASKCET